MLQETSSDDFTEETDDSNIVGSSLDHLIGIWTQSDADEVDAALKEFEALDETLWTRNATP